MPTRGDHRYAIVGTGARAGMYVGALTGDHADAGRIVAWCDTNASRMDHHDAMLADHDPRPDRFSPDRFDDLLDEAAPDTVIITTPDATHERYAVATLDAGRNAVVEKPLCTTIDSARAIERAAADSDGDLVVTFNYRYAPRNAELRRLVTEGAVGDVTSVHFEWALDTVHGADYFRRWHRRKDVSGGLLIHKSSHHFDLVNWWLDDVPASVTALGGLRFYGADNASHRGLGVRAARSADSPDLATDPWGLDLESDDLLRRLYLDAEHEDGYLRDQDVFGTGITIEDNLGLLVGYERGATLTYSLNAHSPWEGYRVTVNGTEGRAELEVVERSFVLPAGAAGVVGRAPVDPSVVDGDTDQGATPTTNPRVHGDRLVLQRHWEMATEVDLPEGEGGHGGGDGILLDDVFRPGERADPLGQRAGHVDGLRSLAVGLAGNRSLDEARVVHVDELDLDLHATDALPPPR